MSGISMTYLRTKLWARDLPVAVSFHSHGCPVLSLSGLGVSDFQQGLTHSSHS